MEETRKSKCDGPGDADQESGHTRRDLMKIALGSLAAILLPPGCRTNPARDREAEAERSVVGIQSIPISTDDLVHLSPGYEHSILYAWGDPIVPGGPSFRCDASNPASEQWQQAGTHHDGMEFFPIGGSSSHGFLILNHESFDDGLIHRDGANPPSAEKSEKGKAACGVSVIEIRRDQDTGIWQRIPSRIARRITAASPMLLTGPAAGHALMQTRADPQGRTVYGTLANCAAGKTPWGTYLTCEENFQDFFKLPPETERQTPAEKRYMQDAALMNQWHLFDERFDYDVEPNEYNRFGWVVEIDPLNKKPARKRTALGRFRHENAAVCLAPSGQVVIYMGDDSRFEYVYKFVSEGIYDPEDHSNIDDLLDTGILYAAEFSSENRGQWIALTHGKNGLDAAHGFDSQGHVLIHARLAAAHVGATNMDRPEWLAVHEGRGEVYVSLTNNSKRGLPGQSAANIANPRNQNSHGHIIRWREKDGDAAAESFEWEIFLLGGEKPGEMSISSPDGMYIDGRGVLWVQTDVASSLLNSGDFAQFGNNQVVAVDPHTGGIRRFLTGPLRCEITGLTTTPDGKTMFVNIQHPGQPSNALTASGSKPNEHGSWPDGESAEVRQGRPVCDRPRSATIVVQRQDGGIIGAP